MTISVTVWWFERDNGEIKSQRLHPSALRRGTTYEWEVETKYGKRDFPCTLTAAALNVPRIGSDIRLR